MSTGEPQPLSSAQRHLLAAATEAFAELGFGGTSTRDIAARANRSPAAVYIHHESKEDLLFAISVRGHETALACLREAAEASTDPVARVQGMVFAFSLWHMDHAKLGRVVQYEFRAMTEEHREQISALRRRIQRLMVAAIEDGVARGHFEVLNARQAAEALLSLSIDLVRWFDPERRRDRRAIARQHADLATRMLRRDPVCDHH
ncbi:TetR/AcrR family transcriptional regulator [Dactylosporangium sp. CA-092794]|uniref:TetR/AcrR family transcriptional regulator n=1 Tax=Dactylosporangium sp. CA-092794 TaxID=3239929 RepID=UPI003D8F8858